MQEFQDWLDQGYDYELPQKGEFRKGILLELDEYGAFIDIGVKHDGFVPRRDIDKLDDETLSSLTPGQEVTTQVMRPVDQEGSLTLSLSRVQAQEDWKKAQKIFDEDEIWTGEVVGYNRGGLLVKFGQLQAFVPASHLWAWGQHSSESRKEWLSEHVGKELSLKLIEINQTEDRLIASERLARQQLRKQRLKELLAELREGEVVEGTVRHLTNFGAFVDIGGAEGLIHISELSWQQVQHPSEVVEVGDEIKVQVLNLDYDRKRISLSLKEMQPNPWTWVDAIYQINQLVKGTVKNVVDFGAFVELDAGVVGLLHVSEIAEPAPDNPKEFVQRGDELILRILEIDSTRQRIGLSLKHVSEMDREQFLAEQAAE